MKARSVGLLGVAVAALAGLVWWRRRSAAPPPAVRIGLDDGSVHTPGEDDPARAELEMLAAGVRDSLTGGT
jgi:heme A synthase